MPSIKGACDDRDRYTLDERMQFCDLIEYVYQSLAIRCEVADLVLDQRKTLYDNIVRSHRLVCVICTDRNISYSPLMSHLLRDDNACLQLTDFIEGFFSSRGLRCRVGHSRDVGSERGVGGVGGHGRGLVSNPDGIRAMRTTHPLPNIPHSSQ